MERSETAFLSCQKLCRHQLLVGLCHMTGKLCTAICHVISPAIEPEKVIHNTITNNMHKIVEKIQCENLVIVVMPNEQFVNYNL